MDLIKIAAYFLLTGRVELKKTLSPSSYCLVNFCVKKTKIMPDIFPQTDLLPNGIYLYGQSPIPEQVLNEYFVFEIRSNKVIGALYLPYSSFNCFYGAQKPGQLDVTVVDSYDNSTFPYNINLQNYHQLTKPSENDLRILAICQNNYPGFF